MGPCGISLGQDPSRLSRPSACPNFLSARPAPSGRRAIPTPLRLSRDGRVLRSPKYLVPTSSPPLANLRLRRPAAGPSHGDPAPGCPRPPARPGPARPGQRALCADVPAWPPSHADLTFYNSFGFVLVSQPVQVEPYVCVCPIHSRADSPSLSPLLSLSFSLLVSPSLSLCTLKNRTDSDCGCPQMIRK